MEQKSPNELDSLVKYIQALTQGGSISCFLGRYSWFDQGRIQGQPQQQPLTNGHPVTNGSGPSLASAVTSGPVSTQPLPPTSHTPVSFTPDQVNALRTQIQAFKLISRGLPIPDQIQQALRVPNNAITDLEKLLQGTDVNGRMVDNAVRAVKGELVDDFKDEDVDPADLPKGPFMEDDVKSGIYPYNAYRHPFTHLKRPSDMDPKLFATRLQRLIIPTIMPTGLDARQIIEERDRFIEARIQQRMRELESLP